MPGKDLQETVNILSMVNDDLIRDVSREAHAKQYYLERCHAYSKYLVDLQESLRGAISILPKDKQGIFNLIVTHLNKEISAHDFDSSEP